MGNFLLQGLVDEIGERYIKVWRYSNEGKGTQMKAYNKYHKYVEYWRDLIDLDNLKCGLGGHSRSLKMAPVDKSHTS